MPARENSLVKKGSHSSKPELQSTVSSVFIQSIFPLRGNQGKGTEKSIVPLEEAVLKPC